MTNNVVTPYTPEEKKKEQSEKTTDDNNAEKSPPQSEDNTTDGNAGGGKRRMRERSPIVKDRGVTGTVKWFSMRKGLFFGLFASQKQTKILNFRLRLHPPRRRRRGPLLPHVLHRPPDSPAAVSARDSEGLLKKPIRNSTKTISG